MDPIELLARPDKWYLGSGDGVIYAPPFPVWTDAPGFWDEATFHQYALGPLFTVTWVDAHGRELPLVARSRRWTPAELTIEYDMPGGMRAMEVRTAQPRGVLASEWSIDAPADTVLHAIAWSVQDTGTLDLKATRYSDGALSWRRRCTDRREVPIDVQMDLTLIGEATSWMAILSERSALQPHWRFTPFVEHWAAERLPRTVQLDGVTRDGFLYAGLHATVRTAQSHTVSFAMRLSAASDMLRGGRSATPLSMAVVRATAVQAAASDAAVPERLHAPLPLAKASRRRWHDFFGSVPHFTCSDPYLERYYWYRWYGLHLNSIQGGIGNHPWPTVCEGIGFFHQPITYSAQCHVRELRWLRSPDQARGVLRTVFARQRPDGSLHGRVYVNHLEGTDFYHANWGDAFEALDHLVPDDSFATEMYPSLARHAEWLVSTRDPDATGMFDVVDQYETGQEYMSRYQAVDPQADAYGWENRIRLKGIDVTVYAYRLFRALERLAPRVAEAGESRHWGGLAQRTLRAVREVMWNPARGMFSDVDPRTMRRTDVSAAVCFYPYFTDLATEDHIEGLERNLLNPQRFWTNYPVPSSPLDDPLFSARAEWKGKRHVCPWNGRVWPMTNSHIIEALARWGTPERPALRSAAAVLLQRTVHMMFHDGDLSRPNCYEHYNPLTGQASVYRGIDDYQHSWIADLIIRLCAGLQVTRDAILVDPLPFDDVTSFDLSRFRIDGKDVAVRLRDGVVSLDFGALRVDGPVGTRLVIPR